MGYTLAGMTLAGAILLGAVFAPTDPVLAGDVQVGPPTEGGEHPIRFALTTEAGLNDGLAFPFVYLGLLVGSLGFSTQAILQDWLLVDVFYRIGVGCAMGVATGWLLGRILFALPKRNVLANTGSGVLAFACVLISYGATELAEGYGFIACFVTGLTLRRRGGAFVPHETPQLQRGDRACPHCALAGLGRWSFPADLVRARLSPRRDRDRSASGGAARGGLVFIVAHSDARERASGYRLLRRARRRLNLLSSLRSKSS